MRRKEKKRKEKKRKEKRREDNGRWVSKVYSETHIFHYTIINLIYPPRVINYLL